MGLPTAGTNGAVGALTTSGVATYPATTTVGQLLWMFITSDSATIPNSFAGWTEYGTLNTSGSMSSRKFYRYADGTEGGTTVTVSGVTGGTMGFCWIASVNRSAAGFMVYPADIQIGTDTTSNSTAYSATAGANWQTQANDLILSFTVHKAAGTLTGNPTGGTITSVNSTLGTNAGMFGARNAANTGYTSLFSRPVTSGGLGAPGQTFTTVGANVTGHSVFIIMREAVAPADPVGITDSASLVQGIDRQQPEPVGITDSAALLVDATRSQPDPVGITDSATTVFGFSPLLSDVVGLTDSMTADFAGADQAVFRDSVSIQGTSVQNTYTFARPGTVQNNDFGWVVMIAGAGSNAPTAPAGWTTEYEGTSLGGGSARMSIYSKRYATGDADPSVVYSTAPGSGNNISGLAFWYANVPVGQTPSIGTVGLSATATNAFVAPSKTTASPNRRMLAISAMKGNGTSFPASASWSPDAVTRATRYATGLFYGSIVLGDWIASSAGATNAQTATWDMSTASAFAVQIEVPSGPVPTDVSQSDPIGITDALALTAANVRTLPDAVGLTDSMSAVLVTPQATFRDAVAVEAITTQTDITFTTPVTVAQDDWGTIVMIAGEGSNPPDAPAGWATMYEGLSGGGTARLSIYGKRFNTGDADPTVSYPTAPSTGNNITGLAFWYYNVPVGQTPTLGAVGTSASLTNVYTAPSKVTATPDRRVVTIGALKGGGSGAPTSGTWAPDASTVASIFASATYYSGIVIGDFMKPTAGATNAQTITWDDSRTSGFAVQMEVPSGTIASYDRAPTEPVGITDAVTTVANYVVNLAEQVSIIDTDAEQVLDALYDTSDPVGLTDTVAVTVQGVQSPAETVGITDAVGLVLAGQRSPADPVGITDSVTVLLTGQITPADPVGITDTADRTVDAPRSTADPLALADQVALELGRSQGDPVGISDQVGLVSSAQRQATDQEGITDDLTVSLSGSAQVTPSDPVGITDAASRAVDATRTAVDPLALTDAILTATGFPRAPSDLVGLSDSPSTEVAASRSQPDPVGIVDNLSVDFAGVSSRSVADPEVVTDAVVSILAMARAQDDPEGITDSVALVQVRLIGQDDQVPIADQLSRVLSRPRGLDELAGITDDLVVTMYTGSDEEVVVNLGPRNTRAGLKRPVRAGLDRLVKVGKSWT